ncbi:MAG: hemolysin XhlA family protein [Clostridioides sp.]|jgi:hypothetical protein|nr:hemolysin XhlA family protein [Clostridioides sp.]
MQIGWCINVDEELVKYKLNNCETKMEEYYNRLEKLEQQGIINGMQIENLCRDLKNLISILKWIAALMATSLVGFVIHFLQERIL